MECTSDAHCTSNSDADPNKAECNIDTNQDGIGDITTNFPANTCVDSAPPVTTMESESLASPVPGVAPGADGIKGTSDDVFWFKQGIYTITVEKEKGLANYVRKPLQPSTPLI